MRATQDDALGCNPQTPVANRYWMSFQIDYIGRSTHAQHAHATRTKAEVATDQERLDPFNGLVLAVHLDALFDCGLMELTVAPSLLPRNRWRTNIQPVWILVLEEGCAGSARHRTVGEHKTRARQLRIPPVGMHSPRCTQPPKPHSGAIPGPRSDTPRWVRARVCQGCGFQGFSRASCASRAQNSRDCATTAHEGKRWAAGVVALGHPGDQECELIDQDLKSRVQGLLRRPTLPQSARDRADRWLAHHDQAFAMARHQRSDRQTGASLARGSLRPCMEHG